MALVSYALVTLADLKTVLGITNNSKDALLEMMINVSTDYIQTQTGNFFKSTAYTNEEYDGTGTDRLILKHSPIVAFTKLEVNTTATNTDSWSEVSDSLYWVDNELGIITRTSQFKEFSESTENDEALSYTIFYKGKFKYRVTYSAGYSLIPFDLQFACISIASQLYGSQGGQDIKTESLGDHSVTYSDMLRVKGSGGGIVEDILSKYRDIPLAN